MYWLYNLALVPAAALTLPALRLERHRAERERLGSYPPEVVASVGDREGIWLHNASVGETLAAAPLVVPLRARLPGRPLVVSATTRAGRTLAAGIAGVDAAVLAPLDWSACVERAIDTLRPAVYVFTETEIWPNLLRALARRDVPAILVSGRISARSFTRYRLVAPFVRRVLSNVSFFGMQTEKDAERIVALGAPPSRVAIVGSLKQDRTAVENRVEIAGSGPIWVAGSTRPGEEQICLAALARLRERHPTLRLVLAPRHLERADEVASHISACGFTHVRRSALAGAWGDDPPVLLLDTLGELAGLYRRAAVAFVGGTLVPIGGHNLLEPAQAGIPVVFGPHLDNVREAAARLESSGGGARVEDGDKLVRALDGLLADRALLERRGRAAAEAASGGGVAERTLAAIEGYLPF